MGGGGRGGGGSHVARLNFKTSRVGVYTCLSLIVGSAVTVAIWPRLSLVAISFYAHFHSSIQSLIDFLFIYLISWVCI